MQIQYRNRNTSHPFRTYWLFYGAKSQLQERKLFFTVGKEDSKFGQFQITFYSTKHGLDWTGLDWTGLDWTGLDWTGLDWTGLGWTGLDWTGLDNWTGLDRWTENFYYIYLRESSQLITGVKSYLRRLPYVHFDLKIYSLLLMETVLNNYYLLKDK